MGWEEGQSRVSDYDKSGARSVSHSIVKRKTQVVYVTQNKRVLRLDAGVQAVQKRKHQCVDAPAHGAKGVGGGFQQLKKQRFEGISSPGFWITQ